MKGRAHEEARGDHGAGPTTVFVLDLVLGGRPRPKTRLGARWRATGMATGGGVTTTLADLPVWALIAGGIVIVVAVMTRLGRRRHAAARAAAFRNAAEETRT